MFFRKRVAKVINRKAIVPVLGIFLFLAVIVLALNLTVNFVFADTLVLNSTNGNLYILNEDTAFTFNVSVNITGSAVNANVTQVNITLPSGFIFITNTNATQMGYSQGAVLIHSFTNTSSVLSWTNTTATFPVVPGQNFTNFIFNVTASTPGSYNLSVLTYNSTGATQSNLTITVQDITSPRVVTFGNLAEADESNVSRNNIVVNITGVDNGFLKNITLYIYNDTDLVNSTNLTMACSNCNDTSFLYNFTGLRDGNYSFFGNVTDTYGNINRSVARKMRLDTGLPIVAFGGNAYADGANLSTNAVYINVTVTETNFKNITFGLFNTTSGVVINTTTYSSSTFFLNVTGLPDGKYTYNVTARDFASNENYSISRTIRIDMTQPSLTLSCTPNPVDQDDTITCSCTGTDTISDMNTSTLSFTTHPSTALTGPISTSCTGADYAGNLGSISASYTVNGPSLNIGGGVGGSSSTTTTTTTTWSDAVIANDKELKEKEGAQVSAALGSSQRIKLKVNGAEHYLGVKSLGTTEAVIEIASTPQTATFKVGESKMFDLDSDGYYEVSVTLVSIEASKANVVIKSVYEKVPAAAQQEQQQQAGAGSSADSVTGASDEGSESKVTNMGLIISVIVVIILVICFFVYKRRDK